MDILYFASFNCSTFFELGHVYRLQWKISWVFFLLSLGTLRDSENPGNRQQIRFWPVFPTSFSEVLMESMLG